MRARVNKTEITVDLISEVTDVGQLSSLAAKLGFTALVEPDPNPDVAGYRVRFVRVSEDWAIEELFNLAVLCAYTGNMSGDGVLEKLRSSLVRSHFPLDRPIQDVMMIGGGPDHDGHDH